MNKLIQDLHSIRSNIFDKCKIDPFSKNQNKHFALTGIPIDLVCAEAQLSNLAQNTTLTSNQYFGELHLCECILFDNKTE